MLYFKHTQNRPLIPSIAATMHDGRKYIAFIYAENDKPGAATANYVFKLGILRSPDVEYKSYDDIFPTDEREKKPLL